MNDNPHIKRLISWQMLRRICYHRDANGRETPCLNPERKKDECARDDCPVWKKLERGNDAT